MVLMLMVRAIALRIIVLLLQQHFFFQNGSHDHNNFKPAHGGLSKPLADISPYLCPSWVSTKDAVLLQANQIWLCFFPNKPLHISLLGLLLSGDVQRNPAPFLQVMD